MAVHEDIRAFVLQPNVGRLQEHVTVVCADTSDSATGAAVFKPGKDGEWYAADTMFAHLSDEALKRSSTYSELEGILKADLALVPVSCRYVLVVCDNFAATIILQRGSRRAVLHNLAVAIFKRCLNLGRVLFAVWQPRERRIVRIADLGSRIIDHFNFSLPMHLFWRANNVAMKIWGRGFQFDRFASFNTAMPTDLRRKLPFNSYYAALFEWSLRPAATMDGMGELVSPPTPPRGEGHRAYAASRGGRSGGVNYGG